MLLQILILAILSIVNSQVVIDAKPYLILSWFQEPCELQDYLPPCLEFDLYNGNVVLSYTNENNTIFGLHVPEVALRTYVKYINTTTNETVYAGYNFFYSFGNPTICGISQASTKPIFGVHCENIVVNQCENCTNFSLQINGSSNHHIVSVTKREEINNTFSQFIFKQRPIEFSWNTTTLFPVAHPNINFYDTHRAKLNYFDSNLLSYYSDDLLLDPNHIISKIWTNKHDLPSTMPPMTCDQL